MSNTKTRTLSIVRTPTHPLRLEPGGAIHAGVDVPKATSSVALYSVERGLLTTWVQPARPEVLIERLSPVRVPTAQEEADRQVLRLCEQLVRKTRSVQAPIKSFLLQHGIAEPADLGHWKASLAVLRGLDLLPELRFCLDLLRDELVHAQEQVQRVTVRLKELAQAHTAARWRGWRGWRRRSARAGRRAARAAC
jgi:hypothetical protein